MPVCINSRCRYPIRFRVMDRTSQKSNSNKELVIAGFFTGGSLAIRGGAKAARNSAIGCACLLAVIEGVGIGFQRMMADNTRLDVGASFPDALHIY